MKTLISTGLICVAATAIALALAQAAGEPDKKNERDPKAFYTNAYPVPPGVFGEVDPKTGKRSMARAILEEKGVAFPEGASAIYNPSSRTLIIRNTPPQLELVEAFIEKLMSSYSARIQLVYQVIETKVPLFPKTVVETKSEGPLPVSKVLNEKDAAALFRQIDAEKKGTIQRAQTVLVNSGRRAQLWIGDLVAAIDPVLAADKATIDLKLGLIIRTPTGPATALPARQATIRPGQTVAVEQQRREDRFQTALITASVVDVRDRPNPEKEKIEPKLIDSILNSGGKDRDLTEEEMESVRLADEIALRGSQKLAAREYEAAAKEFQASIKNLPDHPLVKARRDAYTKQLKNSLRQLEAPKKPPAKETTGTEKLKNLILPSVEFQDTTLKKALEFLEGKSIELDRKSPESNRGVRLILADGESVGRTKITLRLSNVPLAEALRYTLSLANCKSEVEGRTVTVSPMTQADQKETLYTNTYIVPPNFLVLPNASPQHEPPDPIAAPGAVLSLRPTAKEVLEKYGVVFGKGSSATYNQGSSVLIVRQTQDQMDLVEAVVQSVTKSAEKQIYLKFLILETTAPLFPETEKKAVTPKNPYDPDSGFRIVPQPGNLFFGRSRAAGPPLTISTILNPNETADLLRKFENGKAGTIRRAPPVVVRSGQRVEMWIRDQMAEIDPVLGPDDVSVDLNLTLMTGKPVRGDGRAQTTQVTIWDQQTIAIEQNRGQGRYQTALFTSTIIDPESKAVREKAASEQTAKAKPEPKPDRPVRDLTSREQADVQLADEAALRGSQLMQDHEFEKAVKEFHSALKKLPDHPFVEERRDAYAARFWRALLYAEDPEMAPPLSVEATKRKEQEAEKVKRQINFRTQSFVMKNPEGDLSEFLPFSIKSKQDPPKTTGKPTSIPEIAGVFTDPQHQMLLRGINQRKDIEKTEYHWLSAEPGKPVIADVNGRRIGLVGTVGKAGYKIDLDLFFSGPGEPVFEERGKARTADASLTIWDGQTVAYAEPLEKDGEKVRLTFVTAKLVTQPQVELPEKEEPETPPTTPEQHRLVQKADLWALKASQQVADGKLAEAEIAYIECLRLLPDHPDVERRRAFYLGRLLKVWEKVRSKSPPADDRPVDLFPDESSPKIEPNDSKKSVLYTVKKGDTLFRIARDHGTTIDRIKTLNGMKSDVMNVGDQLKIPIREKAGTGAEIDPSDIWFRAFSLLQEGEAAENKGEMLKALASYNEAKPLFDGLARQFPNFYPDIVRFRREQLVESQERLRRSMREAGADPVESPTQQGSLKLNP